MNNNQFCENMNKLRTQHGWSFTDLANIFRSKGVDISAPTLQRYESGKIKNVPYDSIIMLADIFMCSPVELVGWDLAQSHIHPLTKLEEELLSKFRKLDAENQEDVMDYIDLRLAKYEKSVKKGEEGLG